VSRLFKLGRFGELYTDWWAGDANDGRTPFRFERTNRGGLPFAWRALHVIVTPLGAMRRCRGIDWEIV
jgi:hypothetical protein